MPQHSLPGSDDDAPRLDGPQGKGFDLGGRGRRIGSDRREAADDMDAATVGQRVVAFIIDACILLAVWPLAALFSVVSLFTLTPVILALIPLVPLVYHTAFIANPGSATLGMRLMGIRVVRAADGGQPDWPQAIILTLLFYASIAASGLILLWCLFDEKGRCLHDILSGTRIVRRDQATKSL